MSSHTEGPWWWEVNPKGKEVSPKGMSPRGQTTVMDFRRWGMSSAAPVFCVGGLLRTTSELVVAKPGREHHSHWCADIDHPDARLIAAAPELLAAVRMVLQDMRDRAMDEKPMPGQASCMRVLEAAIAKAEGRAS